jgi:hypothetical protein
MDEEVWWAALLLEAICVILIFVIIYLWWRYGDVEPEPGRAFWIVSRIPVQHGSVTSTAPAVESLRETLEPSLPVRRARPRGKTHPPLDPEITSRLDQLFDQYYRLRETHDNSSQNVHDSGVVRHLRRKYVTLMTLLRQDSEYADRIRDLTKMGMSKSEARGAFVTATFAEIRAHVERQCTDPQRSQILTTLDKISQGETISSINGRSIPENWILTLVWRRIQCAENRGNHAGMCEMLMTQLADCIDTKQAGLLRVLNVEEPGTHCVGGRVARVLSVLTLLDSHPDLAQPERDYAEIRNEAMWITSSLVKTYLKDHPAEAELYVRPVETLTEEERTRSTQIEETIKGEIEARLLRDYSGFLPGYAIQKVIQEAQAGVG